MKLKLYFSNEQDKIAVTPALKDLIIKTVCTVIESEKYINNIVMSAYNNPCEISVTFTDNEGIRIVNNDTRGIDSETDVLSFPMFDGVVDTSVETSLGDILLSLEKAEQQSYTFGHSLEREVAFLVAHSVLHLVGYDHIEEDDEREMRSKQRTIMKKLHLEI
jgi:probable rRNA maturation factor